MIGLNRVPGLLARAAGRPVVVVMIDPGGERIHSIFAVANPDKRDAITPAEQRATTPDGIIGAQLSTAPKQIANAVISGMHVGLDRDIDARKMA